jgi:hypothetical protein
MAKLFNNQITAFLLHDNATPHIVKCASDKIVELGWTVLPHPHNNPDLAPSNLYLFRSLKEDLRGHHIEDNIVTLKSTVCFW